MFNSKQDKRNPRNLVSSIMMMAVCGASLGLAGCAGLTASTGSTPSGASSGVALQGKVYGGQQPILGAAIYLYSVNTSITGGASTNLLTTSVTTGAGGTFNITGDWTCTAGTYVYIVAIGGNPQVSGSSTNSHAAMMAGLGNCSNLNSSTFILLNEVTTVASAFALSPFMTAYDHIGADTNGQAGLQRAFNNVGKLANTSNGQAMVTLGSGALAPHAKLYALANSLSACINTVDASGGGASGSCSSLFTAATPSGGQTPTDTIMAAANIAKAPYQNVANIYALAPTNPPFPNQLAGQPTDWALAVTYSGFNSPKSPAVDGSGNVWIADSGSSSVKIIPQSGTGSITTISSTLGTGGNFLNVPSGVVIDASGNAWVANLGVESLVELSPSGSTVATYAPPNAANATAIGIDPSGYIWLAGSGYVDRYNSSGVYQSTLSVASNINALVYNPY